MHELASRRVEKDFERELAAVFCESEGAAEETVIAEKSTVKTNKYVAEVLNQQQQEQSSRKRKATVHSEEARAKFGKYA